MQVMPISKHCSGVATVKTVLFVSTVLFLTVTFFLEVYFQDCHLGTDKRNSKYLEFQKKPTTNTIHKKLKYCQ